MKLPEIISEMEDDLNSYQHYVEQFEGIEKSALMSMIGILSKYLPKLKALNDEDWVSVEKGLPEQGLWYLVNSPMRGVLIMFYDSPGNWLELNDGDDYTDGITHWRPLPTPPNIENSNQ
jgi:Protein of unknown function (DUF551).